MTRVNDSSMAIEEFINTYSTIYMFMFEGKKEEQGAVKSTMTKISEFFFEPRYEVKNLKFKLLG